MIDQKQDQSWKPTKSLAYLAGLLFLTNALSYADRNLLSILMPQIKADLQLSDTGLGLLSGLAFSAFNAVFGLYLARVADRGNRRNLIAVCIAIWSAMTALTGQAQSFLQLLFCRIGVGIGEAGCVPPGHSIISARFDMKYRARVLALHSAGAPVGTLIGLMGGGLLAASYGWRDTFLFLGLPGLAIAALVRWTILEPERRPDESTPNDNSTSESLRILFRKRSFRFTVIGFSLGAFALAGIGQWMPTFLMREFGAGVGLAGTWFGLSFGIGSFCGMVGGGLLATPLIERDVRWAPWLAAMSYVISIPLNMTALFMPSLEAACLVAGLASAAAGIAYGPAFAMIQSVAEPRSRALATAASVFFATFVGQGIGPFAVGLFSDQLAPTFGPQSLKFSLVAVLLVAIFAIQFYVLAAKHLKNDLAARES